MYVSFSDTPRIQVLNPIQGGTSLGEDESPNVGVKTLISYFTQ